MASSYYPVTTDGFLGRNQPQSMASTSRYPTYHPTKKTKREYSDDDDDDLDALRNAALMTLRCNKRTAVDDRPSNHRSSPSSSRSSSSQSSRSRSSRSRSYSSSSLSSISSASIGKHDKDYRFDDNESKPTTGDIDERFPADIPNGNEDLLILDCHFQDDDDLLARPEEKSIKAPNVPPPPPPPQPQPSTSSSRRSSTRHERSHRKPSPKESKRRTEERRRSPSPARPVSVTVKQNTEEFDLRNLIKKRRTDDPPSNNHRVVQILPKDKRSPSVPKGTQDRSSSKHSHSSRSSHRRS